MFSEVAQLELQEVIVVKKRLTLRYLEHTQGFFATEAPSHSDWEFVYVDKGEVVVATTTAAHTLRQGDIFFSPPRQVRHWRASRKAPPNLVVVSFECDCPAMALFANNHLTLGDRERNMLSALIKEGIRKAPDVGSKQMAKLYLELLLISLLRQKQSNASESNHRLSYAWKEKYKGELTGRIIEYMKLNLSSPLSLDAICHKFGLGKTQLKTLFKSETGHSVLEYFKRLKIEHAKSLIRGETYNFTEVAEMLGYSSIHYFSRHFKKVTDMSPSQYAKSVQARML